MPHYEKRFVVPPDTKIKLKELDPKDHGKHESHQAALTETQKNLEKMVQLQDLLYAEKKHSLLIVLQGLDSAGKDGVIRHVFRGMNPQGCVVSGYKQPTEEELGHDFLWRAHPHAPRRGFVAIFNRSHYEDVLVVRVHQLRPEKVWARRYDLINDFERLLYVENNCTILKFFLHISPEEQLTRFKERLDDPSRHWKISEADYKEREYWNDYTEAYEDLLRKTSTKHAPWFIIPSDHKWFRDLAVSQIITNALESLDMKQPEPKVDITAIRRKFHTIAQEKAPTK